MATDKFSYDVARLEWGLWIVSLTMLAENKMKCLLCLSNIPRQRNLRRLESVNYPRLVEVQVLDNDIVAFDLQNVNVCRPEYVLLIRETSILNRPR
jgi:hypothetical protein